MHIIVFACSHGCSNMAHLCEFIIAAHGEVDGRVRHVGGRSLRHGSRANGGGAQCSCWLDCRECGSRCCRDLCQTRQQCAVAPLQRGEHEAGGGGEAAERPTGGVRADSLAAAVAERFNASHALLTLSLQLILCRHSVPSHLAVCRCRRRRAVWPNERLCVRVNHRRVDHRYTPSAVVNCFRPASSSTLCDTPARQ